MTATLILPRRTAVLVSFPWGQKPWPCCKQLRRGVNPNSLVFTTGAGGPLQQAQFAAPVFEASVQEVGARRHYVASLRHSHATMLDATGAPLGTVQALLGHSSSEITREVYLHAIPEDQRKAVAGVEMLVFGPKRTQVKLPARTACAE